MLPPENAIVTAIKARNSFKVNSNINSIPELSDETVKAVKSTLPQLRSHGTAIVTRFYRMLFTRYPHMKVHFNMDRQAGGAAGAAGVPAQVSAMTRTIMMYAGHIDHPEKLVHSIKKICEKHVARSVSKNHYGVVGECFLAALEEVMAPKSEVLDAWRLAYEKLAAIFQLIEGDIARKSSALAGYGTDGVSVTIKKIETTSNGLIIRKKGIELELQYPGNNSNNSSSSSNMTVHPIIRKGQFMAIKLHDVPDGIGDTMLTARVNEDSEDGVVVVRIEANGDRANAHLIATARVGDTLSVGLPVGEGEERRKK